MNATRTRPLPGPLAASPSPRPAPAAARARPAGRAWAPGLILPPLAGMQAGLWLGAGAAGWGLAAAGLGLLLAGLPLLRRRGAPALRPAGWLMLGLLGQLLAGGMMVSAAWGWAHGRDWPLAALLLLPLQAALLPLLMLQGHALAEALFSRSFRRRHAGLAAPLGLPLPRLSLHLPLQDADPAEARATLDALAALDHADFEVLVVDSSADPARWEKVADHCARLGPRFRFFHLGDDPALAEGALDFALREADPRAKVIGLLRPGCAPRPDWLHRLLPLFDRPGLGFAQADLRLLGDGAPGLPPRPEAELLAAHEQDGLLLRPEAALLRRHALEGAGGWRGRGAAGLSLQLLQQGWEGGFLPQRLVQRPAETGGRPRIAAVVEAQALLRRHAASLLNPLDRRLLPGQRRHLLAGFAAAPADGIWLALLGAALLCSLPLAAQPHLAAPLALLAPPLLTLLAFRPLRAAWLAPRHRGTAALQELARMPQRGLAFWRDLLGLRQRGIGSALGLGLLCGLAGLGSIALDRPLWGALLLLGTLPCLASLKASSGE